MKKEKKSAMQKLAILGVGGFLGGIANGILGAGGGIIMTFVLERVMTEEEMARRDIFANVIAASLPISLFSVVAYGARGDLQIKNFEDFVIPALVGGLLGAYLLARINTKFLKRIFAAVVIWSGLYMMLR